MCMRMSVVLCCVVSSDALPPSSTLSPVAFCAVCLSLRCRSLAFFNVFATFILSEGHRASHETVQEHGTLLSGSAAIDIHFVRRTPIKS